MGAIKVYISLVNWYSWQDCASCVKSLEKLEAPDVEIIIGIVDNASPNDAADQLEKALSQYDITRLKTNKGYAAGHLVNLNKAKNLNADYFWILNTDVIVQPESLTKLLEATLRFPNAILGSVTIKNDALIDFAGTEYRPNDKSLTYNFWGGKKYADFIKQYPESMHVQTIEGSSMFIPVSIIKDHDFLPIDYFMYGEESDYCLKLLNRGIKSYIVSQSLIHHTNEGSTKHTSSLKVVPIYYRRRNFLLLNKKYFNWSTLKILGYPDGILANIKTVMKYISRKKKDITYYYALGSIHAAFGIKGKRVKPEKFL